MASDKFIRWQGYTIAQLTLDPRFIFDGANR